MTEQSTDETTQQNEGLFKKPLSGSFKRVANKLKGEMNNKSGEQAIEDDLGGSTVTEEQQANLDRKVEEKKNQ